MNKVEKILLVRTDRIGELLLTTPAMRAVRRAFSNAVITIVVNPSSAEVVEENPYVDSIIKFDPRGANSGFAGKVIFFTMIKKAKFDLAIIFNPSKFFNVLTTLAGIPVRVGYDRKWGFLLSRKIVDRKYLCEKHEVEYNLDLVRLIGAATDDKMPYFPLDSLCDKKITDLFNEQRLEADDFLVAVHLATSNPDKMWPLDRFAQICDRLINEFDAKVILIGGKEEAWVSREIKSNMKNGVLDLTGLFSVKELGSILKKCKFLISNDSGPVHIAAAVGTPTIVFFGEERRGGSSTRWGPYGEGHSVISRPRVCDITFDEAYEVVRQRCLKLCHGS